MDPNEDCERPSLISYSSFLNNLYGGIIPPPPRPAWATASDDDAVIPRDTEMAAVPDCPVDASSTTQLPSSNGNDALLAARSALASNEEISRPSAPPPHLLEGSHFEEPGQDLHRPTQLFSSPTFVPTDEENACPVICDERPGGEEEKLEEEDFAPIPPEMIAASFEAAKPDVIEDNDDTSVPPEQIAAPFEGHSDNEETRMDDEDDYAPVPPEMIAASFEAVMPESIDNDRAPPPTDMVAASFEGHSDEEEKREEVEDDWAPAPPEMVASSYEVNDDTKQEVKKKSEVNEDKDGANINNAQGIVNSISTNGTFVPGIGANSLPEVVDSSSANMLSSSTTNEQVGVSIAPSPRSATDPDSSQGCAEIATYPISDTDFSPGPMIAPFRRDDNDADVEAEITVDTTIVINNAALVNERQVVIGTPILILPWWKERNGQVLIVTALVILAVFVTAIGLSINNATKEDNGDTPATVDSIVPMGKRGPHGTCPSDESAKDCGATLEIWMDILGWSIMNLVVATENLTLSPNRTERLIDTLSGPFNMADNYGCRISGWLVPPITSDEYLLIVSADDEGELWLSADDNPINKVMVAQTKTSEVQSSPISFIAGRSYYFEALVMERVNFDSSAIEWQYPGLGEAEIIPAIYSRTKRPVQCRVDLDCDDGIWCNGDETCNDVGLCEFGSQRMCSDGLLCTDDVCDELTKSCENPTTDCLASGDQCATDQCIEYLGGCQFTCGVSIDNWFLQFDGVYLNDLRFMNLLINTPNKTERLGSLLEAPTNIADFYASRMWGWLVPPITGDYVFWISADDMGELWLSTNDNPENGVLVCFMTWNTEPKPWKAEPRQWRTYPEQESEPIPLVGGQAYFFEALMKENSNIDHLAIAWQYPGQALEVIPARYSRMTRPNTWPATCLEDYDCDDGLWCNGDETCSDAGVCQFGAHRTCSDGLLCTDDLCDELTDSCENPVANCTKSSDPCATDQCIESLGGCQFSCGAILETWTDVDGFSVPDLISATDNFAVAPEKTERLGNLLEAESFVANNYGVRMKGWLVPPFSGNYRFFISSDGSGEFWLSIDDDPANMVLTIFQKKHSPIKDWFYYPEQQSELISLVARQAYYFEAMMKEDTGLDHLVIAWQYPGHALEVIPARFSTMTRPTPNTTNISTSTDMVEQQVDANETNAVSDEAVVQPVTLYYAAKVTPAFSTLSAFIDAAGVDDVLSGPGPITALAVPNYVWASHAANLPAGVTLETYLLLPENIALLKDIVYYHIIDGLHPTSSLASGNLTTLNGFTISVVVSDKTISFNDAYVLEPDWIFTNGIVHVIDGVLVPPDTILV